MGWRTCRNGSDRTTGPQLLVLDIRGPAERVKLMHGRAYESSRLQLFGALEFLQAEQRLSAQKPILEESADHRWTFPSGHVRSRSALTCNYSKGRAQSRRLRKKGELINGENSLQRSDHRVAIR